MRAKPGHFEMRERFVKLVWATLLGAGVLAGCGVKNLPVAPSTKKVPPVVTADRGSSKGSDTAKALRPDSLTASGRNLSISGAEVSKNDVPARPFVLDPLLN
ncbi:hypothetical protein [Jiella mangrovi]|uniref:Lipoprotein n=1 Tax=Jiella mangrovi TaxID=2821407 RepID=A0ABS4BBD8_9HYPH|nr:hypothetical protein [Jiella mangrovi]MBP0614066.1 hypothetical protein [Jiella mangrovi]